MVCLNGGVEMKKRSFRLLSPEIQVPMSAQLPRLPLRDRRESHGATEPRDSLPALRQRPFFVLFLFLQISSHVVVADERHLYSRRFGHDFQSDHDRRPRRLDVPPHETSHAGHLTVPSVTLQVQHRFTGTARRDLMAHPQFARRGDLISPEDLRQIPFRIHAIDGPPPYALQSSRSRGRITESLPPLPSYEDATKLPPLTRFPHLSCRSLQISIGGDGHGASARGGRPRFSLLLDGGSSLFIARDAGLHGGESEVVPLSDAKEHLSLDRPFRSRRRRLEENFQSGNAIESLCCHTRYLLLLLPLLRPPFPSLPQHSIPLTQIICDETGFLPRFKVKRT